MQTQDASAEFLLKFWPWLEANRKHLIGTAVVVCVVLFVWYFLATQREQKAIEAGQAYTSLQLNQPPTSTAAQLAAMYSKLADQYAGTLAAQRAQLQAAAVMFDVGSYDVAQAQFQKFLDNNSGSPLAPAAKLGLAASLEAQNKLADAVKEYRALTAQFPNSTEALTAKFSLGRVLELQGQMTEAVSCYQEVARSQLAGSLAQEAAQRLAQIQVKTPAAAKPVVKP